VTSAAPRMSPATSNPDFLFLRDLLHRHSAIVIDTSKDYLVEARLGPLAKREGLGSITALVAKLRSEGAASPLLRRVIDAMTTNETLFFRDVHPFEALRDKLLPELLERRTSHELNIWSAACSSGQEPYTIAMMLREGFPRLASWKVEILATDLSPTMIAKARKGLYGKIEVNRGLPLPLLAKYFEQQGSDYQISGDLRKMMSFRELNLAGPWPAMGPFDVVFLRNVLIYFDVETKKSILSRVVRLLRPDGYLLLGAAETTLNLEERFERLQIDRAGCYRLRA
jgi:chemotaxis protein methyltransferase CheR